MPYLYNDVTSDTTQLQGNEVTHHVTTPQSPDDRSALPDKSPAPTPTNHDNGQSHVADDVIAVRANGVSGACSRSSSRSSGFDEISMAVTECSLVPATAAHASNDRPEMTSSKTADDGDKQTELRCEERTTKNENCDADSLDTLKITTDNHDRPNDNDDKANGNDEQDSCSSQVKEEETDMETTLEDLGRQIECMSERFNKLFARTKATELKRTESLNEADTRVRHQPRPLLNSVDANTAEWSKYSRNTAYRQWIDAKSRLAPSDSVDRARQPITGTDDDVAMTTDNAPAASSVLIGQHVGEGDDVIEENQASVTSSKVDVTSEIYEETATNHVFKTAENTTNLSELETEKTERRRRSSTEFDHNVCIDLEPTFKPNTCDLEPSVGLLAEKSLTLECPRQYGPDAVDVTLKSADVTDDLNSDSDHPSESHPRSLSAQPDDVFTDSVITTPRLSRDPSPNHASMSRRLLPSIPSDFHSLPRPSDFHSLPRPSSAQPRDVFYDDATSSTTLTLTHGSSCAPRSHRRIRPASSLDCVSRPVVTRRRSALSTE